MQRSRASWGETGAEPGQPQLTPMGGEHLCGPARHTAGNIPVMLARGVSSGWPCPGPFLPALGLFPEAERGLGWGRNRPLARPIPSFRPSPAQLPPFARRLFPCARTRFWPGKFGLEDTFHHSRKTRSQTFHIFSPRHFNDLCPRALLSRNHSRILVRGPNKRTGKGEPPYSCHALPRAF